ncbi:MAG: hypothetical protein KJ767_01925 [Nanoarchaeota archaeon]|nr:hypothetical protein [Nanoarchaeota archaeon]
MTKREKIDYSKPFRVVITEDCRGNDTRNRYYAGDSENLTGQYATSVGFYKYPWTDIKLEEDKRGDLLFKTDSGHYIFARECWFSDDVDSPLEKVLERHDELMKELSENVLKSSAGYDFQD